MAKTRIESEVEALERDEAEAQDKAKQPVEIVSSKPVKAKTLVQAEGQRRALKKSYLEQGKVMFSASPMYKPYFGENMKIMINGFAIFVPLDGRSRSIPKSFAAEGFRKIREIDNFLLKKERRSDIQNNVETTPGDLRLI